jgi:hypothetical protein
MSRKRSIPEPSTTALPPDPDFSDTIRILAPSIETGYEEPHGAVRGGEKEAMVVKPRDIALVFLTCCSSGVVDRPACSPERLAEIERSFVIEVIAACSEHETPEACPAYQEIKVRHAKKRAEWEACQ